MSYNARLSIQDVAELGGSPETPVLDISNLNVLFPKRYGTVAVLDGVELTVAAGECVAVVGESGCGKTLLGLAAADLLPALAKASGTIAFKGRDIRSLASRERRALHGSHIGVVYQDALTSLNPGMSVGAQLRQVCRLGGSASPEQLLVDVGLGDTARILKSKPYQLSGGQRQRVLIAIALARDPELLVADEPTTALDVTVQAQIVGLLQDLQARRRFSLLFISHDLALVSQLAQRIVVMYAGQVVEMGPTDRILSSPRHPYTAGLLAASRSIEEGHATLSPIPGQVRQPENFASGCRFRDRCANAQDDCRAKPALEVDGDHQLACFYPVDVDAQKALR